MGSPVQHLTGERCKRLGDEVARGPAVTITVDGASLVAYAGESVATALLASGCRTFRHTRRTGAPRGLFCGMGICFECVVDIHGVGEVRSCVTPVEADMVVTCRIPHERAD